MTWKNQYFEGTFFHCSSWNAPMCTTPSYQLQGFFYFFLNITLTNGVNNGGYENIPVNFRS